MKKVFAILMSLMLILSIVPQSVFAATKDISVGDGVTTVHWGSYNGEEFKELNSTTTVDTSGTSVDLNVSIDGYYFVGAEYKASASAEAQEMATSTIRKVDGNWQAEVLVVAEDESTTKQTVTLASGSHIYVNYALINESSYTPPQAPPQGVLAPETSKKVEDNGDGTYTITLDVKGHEDHSVTQVGANVIVVMDITQSMTNNMPGGGTRMAAAKQALTTLINTLDPDTNLINFTAVNFSISRDGATLARDWTTEKIDMTGYVSSLPNNPGDMGTNWQAGLAGGRARVENAIANNSPIRNNETYVIFVTDGNPNCYTDDNGRWHGATGPNFSQQAYNAAVNSANWLGSNSHFYGVFCGDAEGYDHLEDLINGANGEDVINGSTTSAIESAFADIASTIVNNLSAGSVVVDDGVPTLSNISANVAAGEAGGFEYYVTPKGGEQTEWTDHPGASYDSTNGVTWNLSEAGTLQDGWIYTLKFTVWPSQEAYDLIADLNNGILKYSDLDDATKAAVTGDIENGYTLKTNTHLYTTFTDQSGNEYRATEANPPTAAMPLPTEYFSITKLWNNLLPQDSRTAQMLTDDEGYLVDKDGNQITDASGNPISRDADNAADYAVYFIDLIVTQNDSDYMEVRLTSADDTPWAYDKLYVAPGFITIDEDGNITLKETGHDYSVKEKPSDAYYWELQAETYHPMVINGESTMLLLVTEDAPDVPENTKQGNYYNIGGKVYVEETADALIKATNMRRSYLNLTKTITGEGADKDAFFEYTITMDDPSGKHSEDTDYDIKNDGFWFSAYNPNAGGTVMDLSATGATAAVDDDGNKTGYWYFDNGGTITIKIKAGWNVRFINLLSGTTYDITEGESSMAPGFSFESVAATAVLNGEDQAYEPEISEANITGKIEAPNTSYTVTYTNIYALKDVTFYKEWVGKDSTRPTAAAFKDALSLEVKVGSGSYESYTADITVEEDGTDRYKITATGLPAYINGESASYRVVEDTSKIGNYEPTGNENADETNNTIINTRTTATLKITKSLAESSDEVEIPDDTEFVISGTPDNGSKFTDVIVTYAKVKDGNYSLEVPAGTYTVTEDEDTAQVTGYTLTVDGDSGKEKSLAKNGEVTFAITNSYSRDLGKVVITKSLAEGSDDVTIPKGTTFTISGPSDYEGPSSVTYEQFTNGEYTIDNAPTGEYKVTETESSAQVAGYTLTVGGDSGTAKVLESDSVVTFSITNKYTADTAKLKLTKTATGLEGTDKIPDDAKFVISGKLLSGEKFEDIELTYEDIKDGKWSETVPVGTYSVTESGAEVTGYDLKTEISNEIQLAKGKEGELTVKNTYTRTKIEITVTKVWKDEENKYGVRPESVKFTVTGSDKATYDVTLKGTGDTWTAKLSIPEYTNGEKNTYTVDEEIVAAGYAKEIKDLTITNTFKPCWGDPPVKKVLEGDKPAKAETFKFKLTAVSTTAEGLNGKMPMPEAAKGAQEMTMDVAAGETKEFGEFPLVVPGVYTYTIEEVAGDSEGYTYSTEKHTIVYTVTADDDNSLKCVKTVDGVEITGEEKDEANVSKFTFTNKYSKPVVTVKVSKIWEDGNNKDLTRPESIKVKLYANGKETDKVLELSKANEWAGSFEDLDKYDADGKEIKYTVDETAIPEGYTADVTGDMSKGFVITNSVDVPPTGDTTNLLLWGGMSLTSLIGLGYLFFRRKREEQ